MTQIILAILAVSALLAVSSLLVPVAERLRLPHTVLLALFGIALGFVASLAGPGDYTLINDLLAGIGALGVTAEAFLYIFLPPLLFTAGLTIDVRRLFDEFAAVLLLAVVAVLVCIAVVGSLLHTLTGFNAIACFLVGAIISTTDPAAVIGIFRDIGAPKRMSIMVEGESLLNDAAAIAVFSILVGMLAGTRTLDIGQALWVFFQSFIGGMVLGYVLARVAILACAFTHESVVGTMTITVSLAYLSFVAGDRYFHVSGIVAVAAAGLTMAALAPTRLAPTVWHGLIEAWHQLDFWANSLIFILAATLASHVLSNLDGNDLWLVMVVVAGAFLARGLVLFGLLPGLSTLKLVQPVDGRYKLTILWGGLRGAVTVVLALVAVETPGLPEEVRHFIGVLSILFVLFTLFVCAPTLRPVMRLFALDRLSSTEAALRDRVMALSRTAVREQVRQVAKTYGFDGGDADKLAPEMAASPDLPAEQAIGVGLLTLAAHERALYLRHFEEQMLSRRIVGALVAAAERLQDLIKTSGIAGYEEGARRFNDLDLPFRVGLLLYRTFAYPRLLSIELADRCEALIDQRLVLTELMEFNRHSLRALLGAENCQALAQLLDNRRQAVDNALTALSVQYAGYAETVRAQYLARAALRFEGAAYRQQLEESVVSREVFDDLQRDLGRRRVEAERRPKLDLGLKLTQMIERVPIFTSLNAQAVRELGRQLRPWLVMPGERIVAKGARGTEMYFIVAGGVDVLIRHQAVRLEAGNFVGEMALLSDQPRNADVVAAGYCHLLVLRGRDFRRLLRANPQLREAIEQVARERLGAPATPQQAP